MTSTVHFGEVLAERLAALRHLADSAPEFPPNLFGPGVGLDEWEAACTRLEVWLRDTIRVVEKYDQGAADQLNAIYTSHARCDPEEDFRRDVAK